MTDEYKYQGPIQGTTPTPQEGYGFWQSVKSGAETGALDTVKGLAYLDTLKNDALSWTMRKYRDVLGVKQPTYLEKHLDLENNQLNHLGEWSEEHIAAEQMHPQSGAGNFIGQAIPFIAAGVAGKAAEGTAAAGRALETEQIAADTAKEAADTAAYNKSALKSGIVHRFATYNASMLPIDAGQSVSFDKKGRMSLDASQFMQTTAMNQIPFGVFEGAGMAFRQTYLKGSTIDLAGSKTSKVKEPTREEITPSPDLESEPEEVEKPTPEEAESESTQQTIDRIFTKEQQEALENEATGAPIENSGGYQVSHDIYHAKESLPYINHAIASNVEDELGPKSLKRATISRFGIMLKGIRRSIRDVQTILEVKKGEYKLKSYIKESGARKFYFSNKLQEYLLENKDKISESRLAEINEQDAALFNAKPWTIHAAQREHSTGFVKSEETGIRTFNYPKWYRILKKEENQAMIKRIRQQAEDGDKAAKYMEAIINETYKSKRHKQFLHVYDDITDAINNPMNEAEQKAVFEGLDNGFEHLGDAERESRLNNAMIEFEEHDKSVYTDPESEFYAKVLSHFDKPELEQYAACMLGA
jgi:hypothetical protein